MLALQGESAPADVLSWMIAVLVSILVHELGHALLQRGYGGHPRIVLHGMGGLAICGDCDRSSRSQIEIALAGPGAGFLFALLLIVLVRLSGHQFGLFVDATTAGFQPAGLRIFGVWCLWESFASPAVNQMLSNLLFINILWGAVNLLPIYPLDGGQIARELCQLGDPRGGVILSLRLSMLTALGMVMLGLLWHSLLVALMFGYFAYTSYKTLQAYQGSLW
jgi:Zn-dependent protease